MAILKPTLRLRMERREHDIADLVRVDVKLSDAEIARRSVLVANATVKVIPTIGKPLKCQKWYQPDYRSATPKGMVLKSNRVRGQEPRWGVK